MNYPEEFTAQARATIHAEKLRAAQELRAAIPHLPYESHDKQNEEILKLLIRYALRTFAAWSHQACELGRSGVWRVDEVESRCNKALTGIARDAYLDKGYDTYNNRLPDWLNRGSGDLRDDIYQRLKTSSTWDMHERELLKIAELQVGFANCSDDKSVVSMKRVGYREHVQKWMVRRQIGTIKDAARELGISHSALKSIMSSKGQVRYGEETLDRVLNRIGYGKEKRGEVS